jgi:hypothetical protein
MSDDIVFRLRHIITMGQISVVNEAADEIERLRIIIENMAERNQKQNSEQLRIVRALEADRDRWRDK